MSIIQMPGAPPAGGTVIGQPEIIDGLITIGLKCTCGQLMVLSGLPGTMRPCANPQCDWAFIIGPRHGLGPQGMMFTVGWDRVSKEPPK